MINNPICYKTELSLLPLLHEQVLLLLVVLLLRLLLSYLGTVAFIIGSETALLDLRLVLLFNWSCLRFLIVRFLVSLLTLELDSIGFELGLDLLEVGLGLL